MIAHLEQGSPARSWRVGVEDLIMATHDAALGIADRACGLRVVGV